MDTLVVSDEFRSSVRRLARRLGANGLVAASGWTGVARQFDLQVWSIPNADHGPVVIVGPPAAVMAHARLSDGEFGFVTPDARLLRRWQRGAAWRDDTTLALFRAGWSVLDVDRVLEPTPDAGLEFLVGDARRTPAA